MRLIKSLNHLALSCAAPALLLLPLICYSTHVLRPPTFRAVPHRLHGIVIFIYYLIAVSLDLVLEHLNYWVSERKVRGERYIKRIKRMDITQLKNAWTGKCFNVKYVNLSHVN